MANAVYWFTNNFIWIQVASMVLSAVFLFAIIRLIIKIDYFSERREYGREIRHLSNLRQIKLSQLWRVVLKEVSRPNPGQWKKAIFEVDDFFDDTLKAQGFIGGSEEERMGKVSTEMISNIGKIMEIHSEISILRADENSVADHEKIKEYLREYRKAFRELGLL
jgi:hypothetical protein